MGPADFGPVADRAAARMDQARGCRPWLAEAHSGHRRHRRRWRLIRARAAHGRGHRGLRPRRAPSRLAPGGAWDSACHLCDGALGRQKPTCTRRAGFDAVKLRAGACSRKSRRCDGCVRSGYRATHPPARQHSCSRACHRGWRDQVHAGDAAARAVLDSGASVAFRRTQHAASQDAAVSRPGERGSLVPALETATAMDGKRVCRSGIPAACSPKATTAALAGMHWTAAGTVCLDPRLRAVCLPNVFRHGLPDRSGCGSASAKKARLRWNCASAGLPVRCLNHLAPTKPSGWS